MFDMVDYHKRQRSIRRVTISALIITLSSFFAAILNVTDDANTQTVLEFLCLSSSLVFLMGLLSSFSAWYEMKMEQWREKILRKHE